jgi:hypothetical protein
MCRRCQKRFLTICAALIQHRVESASSISFQQISCEKNGTKVEQKHLSGVPAIERPCYNRDGRRVERTPPYLLKRRPSVESEGRRGPWGTAKEVA